MPEHTHSKWITYAPDCLECNPEAQRAAEPRRRRKGGAHGAHATESKAEVPEKRLRRYKRDRIERRKGDAQYMRCGGVGS